MESLASADLAALVSDWLTWEQVADLLAVTPAKVKTMVKSHELAAARPGSNGSPAVPALFGEDGEGWVVKGLHGLITGLHEGGNGELYWTDDHYQSFSMIFR
jgi:excisionase family DNA binding protein